MRPGPESPSCQRSLPRGDTYQPAVTPSTSLGTQASGSSLPAASPGARGIELDSSLGVLAFPSLEPWASGHLLGLGRSRRGRRKKAVCSVGAGGRSPTLPVLRHLPEPARDKLAEPAAHETRLPAASAAVCIGQPCLNPPRPVFSVSLLWVGAQVLRPHERWGLPRIPAAQIWKLRAGTGAIPSSRVFTRRLRAALQPVRAQGQQGSPPQGPGSMPCVF